MPEIDQPFALRRRFEQLALPPLLLGLGIFLWSVYAQEKTMSERVYVELERYHLQTIIDAALSHDERLRDVFLGADTSDQGLSTSLLNFEQRLVRENALKESSHRSTRLVNRRLPPSGCPNHCSTAAGDRGFCKHCSRSSQVDATHRE